MGAEEISDYLFDKDDIVISCMGRNDYIKGIWHLVKAFSIVCKKHPKARLVVVGAGDFSGYEELADKLGVGDKVFFPGVRKNPFAYVSKSDIYVCSSNHEGFPNAVLEAMALKKPVISADCKTGPREILLSEDEYENLIKEKPDGRSVDTKIMGTYGILVPDMGQKVNMEPETITDGEKMLADAICNMIEDESLRAHYGEKSLERAFMYTPDRYKESIHEIFKGYEQN